MSPIVWLFVLLGQDIKSGSSQPEVSLARHSGKIAEGWENLEQTNAGCQEEPQESQSSFVRKETVRVVLKNPDDRVEESFEGGRSIYHLRSPRGIGTVEIHKKWPPEPVTIRFSLGGLEMLRITTEKMELVVSVSTHDPSTKHIRCKALNPHLSEDPLAGQKVEVYVRNAQGMVLPGLPSEGGYFEILLPGNFFRGEPSRLSMEWIDFYRK